jgi:hypothetical protein
VRDLTVLDEKKMLLCRHWESCPDFIEELELHTTNRSEVRRYFEEWLDSAFRNELMDRHKRERTLRAMKKNLPALVDGLNRFGQVKLDLGPHYPSRYLTVFLRQGHLANPSSGSSSKSFEKSFNLFEMKWAGKEHGRKLRCFLGSRSVTNISDSLRINLRYVLEPSRVELVRSGTDMAAVGFFDDIVEKIRTCDFCIFDNQLAEEKANVYIEVGIAYALKRPFILANYKGNRLPIPSDLTHILHIPYTNYKDLCRTLYFNLPLFLRDTGLRKPLSSRSAG